MVVGQTSLNEMLTSALRHDLEQVHIDTKARVFFLGPGDFSLRVPHCLLRGVAAGRDSGDFYEDSNS